MTHISVDATIEVNINYVLSQVSDEDLIRELKDREIHFSEINLTFEEEDLIEIIIQNKSIIEADKIKQFFNIK